MIKEESFGIIPLQKEHDTWNVYIIQHREGHWTFPKGHAEPNEKHLETATRELKEETQLSIENLLQFEPLEISYSFMRGDTKHQKTVVYFLAIVSGAPRIQEEELSSGRWIPLKEAAAVLTYSQDQDVALEAQLLLP